ncbi:MAG: neuromedin U [Myxococcaceae bacterium]
MKAKHGLLLLVVLSSPGLAPASAANEAPAAGEAQGATDADEELAKKTQNPVADLITVPFQSNTNFGVGPANAVQEVLNIQPVIPIHIGTFNLITRTIIPLISQPNIGTGESGSIFGLGNINTTLFLSPKNPGGFIWGIGPVFGFPTNTSPALGSAKWTFGPSVVLLTMPGPWVLGILVNNVWSWAGGGSQNVNSFLLQYFVNYNFPGGWYLTSSPLVTANWLATPYGNKWTFPVGGGFGKLVRLGRLPLNLNAAGYYNIWRPSGGPSWQLRLTAALLF